MLLNMKSLQPFYNTFYNTDSMYDISSKSFNNKRCVLVNFMCPKIELWQDIFAAGLAKLYMPCQALDGVFDTIQRRNGCFESVWIHYSNQHGCTVLVDNSALQTSTVTNVDDWSQIRLNLSLCTLSRNISKWCSCLVTVLQPSVSLYGTEKLCQVTLVQLHIQLLFVQVIYLLSPTSSQHPQLESTPCCLQRDPVAT